MHLADVRLYLRSSAVKLIAIFSCLAFILSAFRGNAETKKNDRESSLIKAPETFNSFPYQKKKDFPFNGMEVWYGIYEGEVRGIPGVSVRGGRGSKIDLYKSREQLEAIAADDLSISVSSDPELRYFFTGIDQIVTGAFKKARIGQERCVLYVDPVLPPSMPEAQRKHYLHIHPGKVCGEEHTEIKFDGKESKLIMVYKQTEPRLTSNWVWAEFYYLKSEEKIFLGYYADAQFHAIGDLNRDGEIDFIVTSESGERRQSSTEIFFSNSGKWNRVSGFLAPSTYGYGYYQPTTGVTNPPEPQPLADVEKLKAIVNCPVPENSVANSVSSSIATWHFRSINGVKNGPAYTSKEYTGEKKVSAVGCFKDGKPSSIWKQIDASGKTELELSFDEGKTKLNFIEGPPKFKSLLPLPFNNADVSFYDKIKGKHQLGVLRADRFHVFCSQPETCGEIVGKIEDHGALISWGGAPDTTITFDLTGEGKIDLSRQVYEVKGDWCLTQSGWIYGEKCLSPPEQAFAYKGGFQGIGLGVSDRTIYEAPGGEESAISKKWKEQTSDADESPFELMGIIERKTVNGIDWVKVKLRARDVDYDDPEEVLVEEIRLELFGKEFWIRLYGEQSREFNFYLLPTGC